MKPSDVTVEIGLQAFEQSGLKPHAGVIYRKFDGNDCGCLMGALALSKNPVLKDLLGVIGMLRATAEVFGEGYYDDAYSLAGGFDDGFTGKCAHRDDSIYRTGYQVGREMKERYGNEIKGNAPK